MTAGPRRDFLQLLHAGFLYLSGALALGGLLRFLDYEPNPAPQTEFDLGPASGFPANSRTLLPQVPAILIHDEGGYRAISLVCTHLGCTLEEEQAGFRCPCHASRFDAQGNVLQGPADRPLERLRVEVTEDGTLHLSMTG